MEDPHDYTSKLFRAASPLFLYLVSFRRKVRKGYQVRLEMVREDLERLFEEMERETRVDPRLDALWAKAKYPLAVLADEVLLHSEWEHAKKWESGLLEQHYFQTNIGGDKIFSVASELRHDEVELAAILYTAIALGVRGSYFRYPEKLAEVKSKLYRQMSEYLADAQKQLTPAAYVVDERPARKISRAFTLAQILLVGFGAVLLYWLGTLAVWKGTIGDLRDLVRGLGL